MLASLTLALAMLEPSVSADAAAASEAAVPTRPIRHAIEVDAGASCLDGDRIASKVISALGKPEVDRRIEVSIVGDAISPLRIRFEVHEQHLLAAERNFAFEPETTCDEKHAVVSVAVALAIDATLVEDGDGPPIDVPLEPRGVPQVEGPSGPRTKPEPEPITRPPSKWSVRIGIGTGLSVHAPPVVGGYGELAVDFGFEDSVDLVVAAIGGSSGRQAAGDGRATLGVVGGRGAVCGGYRWRIVRPRGCAGVIVGAGLATGEGFADDRTSGVPWVAPTLGADLRIRVAPRVELELGGDVVIHAVRPAFDFLDENQRRTPGREFPLIGGIAGFGVVVALR